MKLNILKKFLDKNSFYLESPILQIKKDKYRFLASDNKVILFTDWFELQTNYKEGYFGLVGFNEPPFDSVRDVKNLYFECDKLFINHKLVYVRDIKSDFDKYFNAIEVGAIYTSLFVDKEAQVTKYYDYKVGNILFAKNIIDKLFKVFKVDCISFDIYKSKLYPVAVGRIKNHNFLIPCGVE